MLQPRLQTRVVEEMRAGKLPGRLHFLPANGTVVGIVLQVLGGGQRVVFFHVVQHPKVVSVLLELSLDFIGKKTKLHNYDEACHREENIRPK